MENERLARVEEQLINTRDDVKEIKADVKALLAFKWKLLGAAMIAAFLATSLAEVARALGR